MLSLKSIFSFEKLKIFNSRAFKTVFYSVSIFSIFVFVVLVSYHAYSWGKIYTNINLSQIPVGGLSPEEAVEVLSEKVPQPETIKLFADNQEFVIKLSDFDFSYDYNQTVTFAYDLYRTGNFLYDIKGRFKLLFDEVNYGMRYNLNEEKLRDAISAIAGQVSIEPVYPTVSYVQNNIVIDRGKSGINVDSEKLLLDIEQLLAYPNKNTLTIPTSAVNPTWNETDTTLIRQRAETLKDKSLTLVFEHDSFTHKGNDLIKLLDKGGKYNEIAFNKIIDDLKKEIERNPENSVFIFNNGKVEEFTPSKDGILLNVNSFSILLTDNLKNLESLGETALSFEVPVERTPPQITTSEVNNLGIKELIGRGTSSFSGSISSRIHNVGLAASRFNGILVEPGKTVSFNEILGDVSAYTGYKQAYIIQDGKTVLGDGGGVCQVSTTLFRALLNAGLPITERRSHSYRVGYYEQGSPPGLDATVFAPTTDLKFVNDTPGHILIQSLFDPKKYVLDFEIYGTRDGRIATTTKPIVTSVSQPPEDLYIDDPTLPAGQIKQIDYKAWGAKVTFNYTVIRNGETIINKSFVSNYRPWQAKFLKGTGPAN